MTRTRVFALAFIATDTQRRRRTSKTKTWFARIWQELGIPRFPMRMSRNNRQLSAGSFNARGLAVFEVHPECAHHLSEHSALALSRRRPLAAL